MDKEITEELFFSDENILGQSSVTIHRNDGSTTNGIRLVVDCESNRESVGIVLEYSEIRAALAELATDRAVNSKEEVRMEWTKKTPVTPGWYWVRNTCDEEGMEPTLDKVFEFDGKLMIALEGGTYLFKSHDALEFYGPLEPPK